MSEWLLDIITAADSKRRPDFAQQSALNWMKALAHEISAEHGNGFDAQWEAVEKSFAAVKKRSSVPHQAQVYEPLYAATTFAASLASLASQTAVEAWQCPGAIVEWYYAVYNSLRAMLAAYDTPGPEKHTATANAVNGGVRRLLPHPLNMRAMHLKNEKFQPELPSVGSTKAAGTSALTEAFDGTRPHAQQMLLSYMSGTADFYVGKVKESLLGHDLKKLKLADFRTKVAQEIRNKRLSRCEYNFLHVAFRYRGKANYRDAVFLAYGRQQLADGGDFATDLAHVARFVLIVALVYVKRRVGDDTFDKFTKDLGANFRGYKILRNFP
jgi:hypothetical protein